MLQSTNIINAPRADFHRDDFETIIHQKGREVIIETSLQCPCKSKASNQQSNCRNCGGTGWVFINARSTRVITKGIKITPDYKAWSEEIKGDMDVIASDTEDISYMDRLTLVDGKATHKEVLFFKVKGGVTFAFTAYNIKEIKYIGYFEGVDNVFRRLVIDVDYTYDKNIVRLINPSLVPVQDFISITIRYTHAPTYLMNDMKRETMESFEFTDKERLIHLPISGTARRSHYILTAPNLNGDRLLDNSYQTSTCH